MDLSTRIMSVVKTEVLLLLDVPNRPSREATLGQRSAEAGHVNSQLAARTDTPTRHDHPPLAPTIEAD
jgi:hypothetical protein